MLFCKCTSVNILRYLHSSAIYKHSLEVLSGLLLDFTNCVKKISSTLLHQQQQSELWLGYGRIDPCFHVTYRKFRPYYPNIAAKWRFIITANIFPVFFYPVLVSTCMVFCCCSPLASRFRDALLLSSVKTSGYLRYCCLLLSS